MAFTRFLEDARSVSMRYDVETDRIIQELSRQYGVTPGVIVRMAFREMPDTLSEAALAYIRKTTNRMKGRRTTWVEDASDRERLDAMVAQHEDVSRRGILRYAVRLYATRRGIAVEEAA